MRDIEKGHEERDQTPTAKEIEKGQSVSRSVRGIANAISIWYYSSPIGPTNPGQSACQERINSAIQMQRMRFN